MSKSEYPVFWIEYAREELESNPRSVLYKSTRPENALGWTPDLETVYLTPTDLWEKLWSAEIRDLLFTALDNAFGEAEKRDYAQVYNLTYVDQVLHLLGLLRPVMDPFEVIQTEIRYRRLRMKIMADVRRYHRH